MLLFCLNENLVKRAMKNEFSFSPKYLLSKRFIFSVLANPLARRKWKFIFAPLQRYKRNAVFCVVRCIYRFKRRRNSLGHNAACCLTKV